MGLLDLAAGFAGGAGHALAETEMTNFKSLVEQDRQAALMKMQSNFRQEEHKANAVTTEEIRREGRRADFVQDAEQAPMKADMAADAAKKMELAKFSDEVIKARESALNLARSGDLGFKMDNLDSLTAVERAEARAKHIESGASVAQADLAKFQLGQAQKVANAQDALAQAESSGDAVNVANARKQLASLNSKGDDPRDAATLLRTSEGIRRQAKDELDLARKADLERKAEQFEALALSQMNISAQKSEKNGFDPNTGDVWKGGKIIGSAKTEKDAREMFAGKPANKRTEEKVDGNGENNRIVDDRKDKKLPAIQRMKESVLEEEERIKRNKAGRIIPPQAP